MIWFLFALLTKHFVVDFLLQPPWMWKNKGKILHLGGWAHAALHGWVTGWIVVVFVGDGLLPIFIWLGEMWAHFWIDWAKVNINGAQGWKCDRHPQFWWLLGLDQYLHGLCYVAIIALVAK